MGTWQVRLYEAGGKVEIQYKNIYTWGHASGGRTTVGVNSASVAANNNQTGSSTPSYTQYTYNVDGSVYSGLLLTYTPMWNTLNLCRTYDLSLIHI